LLETQALQQITIESIAKEAGVGKATIYRWWPSKASVVIEAFVINHIVRTPMPTGVSCREAISTHIHRMVEQYGGRGGRIVAQILAEGQNDAEILREFRERFFDGRRTLVRAVIEQGRKNGEFRTDLDPDFEMDMLYSPIYFRLIMGHLPLDKQFADGITENAVNWLSAPSALTQKPHPTSATRKTPQTNSSASSRKSSAGNASKSRLAKKPTSC
jgi:AcrR family transcriptional regulator